MLSHAAILRRAAEILEVGGWIQGDYGPSTNMQAPHCAVGAIRCAMRNVGSDSQQRFRGVTDALERAISTKGYYPDIVDWNDVEGRTKDEVVAALRRAADEVDAA